MAVLFGNTTLSFPRKSMAALIPATMPEEADSTYPSTPVICPAK